MSLVCDIILKLFKTVQILKIDNQNYVNVLSRCVSQLDTLDIHTLKYMVKGIIIQLGDNW